MEVGIQEADHDRVEVQELMHQHSSREEEVETPFRRVFGTSEKVVDLTPLVLVLQGSLILTIRAYRKLLKQCSRIGTECELRQTMRRTEIALQ